MLVSQCHRAPPWLSGGVRWPPQSSVRLCVRQRTELGVWRRLNGRVVGGGGGGTRPGLPGLRLSTSTRHTTLPSLYLANFLRCGVSHCWSVNNLIVLLNGNLLKIRAINLMPGYKIFFLLEAELA